MAILFEEVIPAWYGSCSPTSAPFQEGPWNRDLAELAHRSNGLVAAAPDGFHLMTGTVHGDLRLIVELLDSAPEPHLIDWEAVVDVSLLITDGTLTDHEPSVEFRLPEPGWYRLRASARGRADAYARHNAGDDEDDWEDEEDGEDEEDSPLEEHRITLWLASPQEELVWKHDGVHVEPGGRRLLPALGLDSHPGKKQKPLPDLGINYKYIDLDGFYDDSPGNATP